MEPLRFHSPQADAAVKKRCEDASARHGSGQCCDRVCERYSLISRGGLNG
jgi:hypothetical protein